MPITFHLKRFNNLPLVCNLLQNYFLGKLLRLQGYFKFALSTAGWIAIFASFVSLFSILLANPQELHSR